MLGIAACPSGSLAAKDVKRTPLVTIGWTAWADAEAVSRISKTILKRELGVAVKLVMADIEVQYPAVDEQELSEGFFLMKFHTRAHDALS